MKKIIFKKQALKFLKKQNKKAQQRLIDSIYDLPDGDVKPLQGVPYKRLRVGTYRVIFDEKGCVYTIQQIGNRGDVYK